MAGKYQHYIPQFLQRGFSCQAAQGFMPKIKKDNQNAQIWLFKHENIKISHIRKKGGERYFYGAENSHVDKTITEAEGSYAHLVNSLRKHTISTPINESQIPGLVAHMISRTNHIRQLMQYLGGSSLNIVQSSLPNSEDFFNFLVSHLQKNLDNHIDAKLTVEQQKIFREAVQDNPEFIKNSIGVQARNEIHSAMHDAIFDLKGDVVSLVRDAHIDFLSESIEPQIRVDALRNFRWFVSVERLGSYIIGDSLVICQRADGSYSSAYTASEEIQCIFLPISSQHLLIGTKGTEMPVVSPEDINYASACWSSDFFIASQNTEREIKYQKDLGRDCLNSLDEKTEEMTN